MNSIKAVFNSFTNLPLFQNYLIFIWLIFAKYGKKLKIGDEDINSTDYSRNETFMLFRKLIILEK